MKRISYNQLISRFINEDTCLLDECNTINTVCGTKGYAVSYLFLELRDTAWDLHNHAYMHFTWLYKESQETCKYPY